MKLIKYTGILFFVVMISCSTSRITSTWKATDVEPKAYTKILVVGLLGNEDRTTREKMENHLVGDLKDLGYNAVSAITEFGPKEFENMSEDAVLAKLNDNGIDAILTIVLLNKSKEKYYLPAKMNYSPYLFYQDHFWNYYETMHNRIYNPGYYTIETKYFWESNFYNMTDKKLLYSVQTESFDPGSTESLAHEYGRLIVKDIVRNNILTGQTTKLKAF